MVRTVFSGQEIISVLTSFGYVPKSHRGSHVRLRYENEDTGEVGNVDVPLHDEIRPEPFARSPISAVQKTSTRGANGSTPTPERAFSQLF